LILPGIPAGIPGVDSELWTFARYSCRNTGQKSPKPKISNCSQNAFKLDLIQLFVFYALVILTTHPAAKCITVVFGAAATLARARTLRAASNSHSDGISQSFDSEAPSFGADAQAAFTGDLNTARAGSSAL